MQREEDGQMTFDRSEIQLIRAALFTIEHYMDHVWDAAEISAVAGYQAVDFQRMRRAIDDLATANDEHADAVARVRGNLRLFESGSVATDHQRKLKQLRFVIGEARSLGIEVSSQLLSRAADESLDTPA